MGKTRKIGDTISDNLIFADIVNDRIGIGTTTPSTSLSVVGIVSATAFSGNLPTTNLTGTITNDQLDGSITDAKLSSTFLKNAVEDTEPQLGGNLDFNSKFITGTGGINVTGVVTATSFSGDGSNLSGVGGVTTGKAIAMAMVFG